MVADSSARREDHADEQQTPECVDGREPRSLWCGLLVGCWRWVDLIDALIDPLSRFTRARMHVWICLHDEPSRRGPHLDSATGDAARGSIPVGPLGVVDVARGPNSEKPLGLLQPDAYGRAMSDAAGRAADLRVRDRRSP